MQKSAEQVLHSISIKALTWSRDSHGLFDYQCKNVTKSFLKIQSPSTLVRIHNDIHGSQTFQAETLPETGVVMARIHLVQGHYAISPIQILEPSLSPQICDKMWLVVKYLKSKSWGYHLVQGDVLKFGRIKYRVKELKYDVVKNPVKDFSLSEMVMGEQESSSSEEQEYVPESKQQGFPCRVCLRELHDQDNPLISPCNCAGTMKYIHIKCLQRCLKSKLTTRSSDRTLSFGWKTLCCDLCKKNFPYKLAVGGKIVELLDIPKPPGKYIILEALCKDRNANKGLHVISMYDTDTIKMGRGHDCQLRVSDVSVSRSHATINFRAGNFYIEDTGSKFGTLVQVKRPLSLQQMNPMVLQIGRSLVTISFKTPWSIIPACFKSRPSPFEGMVSLSDMRAVPLLPVNTGIPLSITDPQELFQRVGAIPMRPQRYNQNNNLLFEHNQLGNNSSFEDEEEDMVEVEEVEIAEIPEETLEPQIDTVDVGACN